MPPQEPQSGGGETLEQYYARRRKELQVRETTMPRESTRVDLENVPRGRARTDIDTSQITEEEGPSLLERGIRFGAHGVDYAREKYGELKDFTTGLFPEQDPNQPPIVEAPPPIPWWLMVGGAGGGAKAIGSISTRATSLGTSSGIARSTTAARALGRRQTGEILSKAAQQGAARSIPTERAATSVIKAEQASIRAEQAARAAEEARIAKAAMEADRMTQTSRLASPSRISRATQAARSPQALETSRLARTTQNLATARSSQAAHLAERARGSTQVAEMAEATRPFSPLYQQGVGVGKAVISTPLNPSELSRLMSTLPNEMARNEIRLGMLEGFRETISNYPRITKAAQQHLSSPAGRAVLREALHGMPDDMFRDFMLMVERGRWTEVRKFIIKISTVLPILGWLGRDLWRVVLGRE